MVSLSTCSHTTRSGLGLTRKKARKARYQGEGLPRLSNTRPSEPRTQRSGVSGRPDCLLRCAACAARRTKAIDLEREPERC